MTKQYLKIKNSRGIYYVYDGQVKVDHQGFMMPPRRFKQDFKLWFKVTKMTDGKRIYKKKTIKYPHDINFKSAVLDAEEKKKALQSSINTNVTYVKKDVRDLSLDVLFDSFILRKSKEIKPRTKEFYAGYYNKHIKPVLGDKKLKNITKYELNNLANNMRLNGYKERTVLSLKQILRPLFNYHLQNGDITVNPALQIETYKLNNEVEINLSMKQIKDLMRGIEEYPIQPFKGIFTFLSTGRRLNEILSLKWENIDLEQKKFTISKENSKNSKTNEYPLTTKLINALPEERKSGFVFHSINNEDKAINKSTLKPHWRRILDNAGIEHLRIHDIRHIIGNVMISNGASLTEIAELLGHSSTTVTKRYSKSEVYSKQRSLDRFYELVG